MYQIDMLHTLNVYNVIHKLYLNFKKETLENTNRDDYTLPLLIIMTFMSFFFSGLTAIFVTSRTVLNRSVERDNPYFIPNLRENNCLSTFDIILVWASLVAQAVKNLRAMQETHTQSLGLEDPLEKEMATHSSILAWKIPWTEEPGGLQSIGLQRVGHD